MKLARLVVAMVAVVAASAVVAQAAGFGGLGAPGLGAGGALVARCDDSVGVTYLGAPGPVLTVEVSGVAAACAGGRLSLTVTDGTGAAVASGTANPVASPTVTVPLTPHPTAEQARAVRLAIVGP